MIGEVTRTYLERRARQERESADRAADPCSYRSHTELAREYERRLLALAAASAGNAEPRGIAAESPVPVGASE